MNNIKISASILAADFARLGSEIVSVVNAGADAIHVDILDGHFAPNISFGVNAVALAAKNCGHNVHVEAHMMVSGEDFLTYHMIPAVIDAGVSTVIIHAEVVTHLDRMLRLIKSMGAKAGVALNPATNPQVIEYLLNTLDMILIMSVNPGFAGQTFIPEILKKITVVQRMIGERSIVLSVDGGVNTHNCSAICQAGANMLVAGTSIFGEDDYAKAIVELRGLYGKF